ncbi:polymer-forming cytoskeletal protein [Thiobacillus sp.]|uniref:bactofilin family protein n=1 Tax=Thiobacillus sp. TaxID=924 RepID=UPI0025DAEE97|nr:polymer-forming cytoskeletal protein [Thiobacillus sp.]MBT9538414.1 polymer-forming cytoskeletal protein [Thiobacillus sp.]
MLKSFMQPGHSGQSKTDSTKTSHAGYPVKPAEAPKAAVTAKAVEAAPEALPQDPAQYARNEEGSKLIVGPNIKLKGSEITDCEILVVEGRVEASMNSRDIRIAEGGVFSGKAEIDVAEVRGIFEGELTARKRLVIYATGKVTGVIRYGAMMIEEGGTLSGDVQRLATGPSLAKLPEAAVQTPTPDVAEASTQEPELEQIHFGSTLARNLAGRR